MMRVEQNVKISHEIPLGKLIMSLFTKWRIYLETASLEMKERANISEFSRLEWCIKIKLKMMKTNKCWMMNIPKSFGSLNAFLVIEMSVFISMQIVKRPCCRLLWFCCFSTRSPVQNGTFKPNATFHFELGFEYYEDTCRRAEKTLVKIETQEKDAMCKNVTSLRDTEKVLFCGLTE